MKGVSISNILSTNYIAYLHVLETVMSMYVISSTRIFRYFTSSKNKSTVLLCRGLHILQTSIILLFTNYSLIQLKIHL